MKFPIIGRADSGDGALHPDGEIGMFKAATAGLEHADDAERQHQHAARPGRTCLARRHAVASFTRKRIEPPPSDRWTPSRMLAAMASSSPSISKRPTTNVRSRTVISEGALLVRAASARVQRWELQRPPVRHGTGSTAGACGTWQYIEDVRKMVKGPLLIKGILDPEDAKLAIEHGADAIIVSNHGGRSMDLRSVVVGGPTGDRGCRERPDSRPVRWWRPSRLRHFQGARTGGQRRHARTDYAVGPCGIRHRRRTAPDRDFCSKELVQVAAAAGCAKLSDINKTTVKANFV